MLRHLLNQLCLEIRISIQEDSRLLIAQYDNTGSKQNIKESVKEKNGKYYIPGSTLKGNFRSRAEYISSFVNTDIGACHIFSTDIDAPKLKKELSCGIRFDIRKKCGREPSSKEVFRQACPICQTFGHNFLHSRVVFTDFQEFNNSASRKHQTRIAVDRATGGGVSGKLFTLPYLVQGSFTGRIIIKNFQIWQLGLIGLLLQDLDDGFIRLGHNQSSGSGRMVVDELSGKLSILDQNDQEPSIKGIMALSDSIRSHYRPQYDRSEDFITLETREWQKNGVWREIHFVYDRNVNNASIVDLPIFSKSKEQALGYMGAFSYPQPMSIESLQALMHTQSEQEVR